MQRLPIVDIEKQRIQWQTIVVRRAGMEMVAKPYRDWGYKSPSDEQINYAAGKVALAMLVGKMYMKTN